MWLACSQRCGGELFRALFAEVDLDAAGLYLGHHVVQQGYLCLNCGSPAFDLGDVPSAMETDQLEEVAEQPLELLCPVCETRVSVLPGEECPNCGAELAVAEPEG